MMKTHELKVGDIIFGVDGVEHDEIANTAELFIKLRKTPATRSRWTCFATANE